MEKQYIEKRDEGYWVAGTRISLDSVVLAFLDGLSPETIVAECFPVLTLEQIYGAITYYLSRRDEINAYLKQAEAEFEALRQNQHIPGKWLQHVDRCKYHTHESSFSSGC